MSDSSRWRRDLLVKAALAVVAPIVFLAGLELLFALGGVEAARDREDPFVGFAGSFPTFVPERTADGEDWLVTADGKLEFFNYQRFPRRKEPGTFRIFCLGGSTTFGRPYDDETSFAGWLRSLLPAADASRRWEVINAGGVSYASYRVARLMEEIVLYEPDLLIVYTGHNEFLEERTYAAVRDLPAPVRALSAALSRTRTWGVMASGMRKLGVLPDDEAAETRFLMPETVAARLDRSAGIDLYERDDSLREQILAHYRSSLERMVDVARSAGSELVFVTPASNLRSLSPFKSEPTDGLAPEQIARSERLLEIGRRHVRAGGWTEALQVLDEALALDPRSAALHYERGAALFGLGRFGEAKPAFVRARDEDVCPLRALTEMRTILEEVARGSGTPLVDFVALLERDLELSRGHAILGAEDFLDHVHPTIDGHRRLALALLETMRRERLLPADAALSEPVLAEIRQRVEGAVDPRRQAEALASLAWTLEWAGKEDESRRLALEALASGAESVRILLIAGKHYALEGDVERAMDLYRRAVLADPLSPTPRYQMGLLSIARRDLEAAAAHFLLATVLWPEDAKAHEKLGLVLAERGRYDLAIASLQEARRRDPGRPAIDELIERVRRYSGVRAGPGAAPPIALERYPSGVVRRVAQTAEDASGETIEHGIRAEWSEDGLLLSFADAADGEIRGAAVYWDESGRRSSARAPS